MVTVSAPLCCLFNSELTHPAQQRRPRYLRKMADESVHMSGSEPQYAPSSKLWNRRQRLIFGWRSEGCCCCCCCFCFFSAGWIIPHPVLSERHKHRAEGWGEASHSQAALPAVTPLWVFIIYFFSYLLSLHPVYILLYMHQVRSGCLHHVLSLDSCHLRVC